MSQPAQKVHLGVIVRGEQRHALARLAERDDRSVSWVTRAAIDAYLERERARRVVDRAVHYNGGGKPMSQSDRINDVLAGRVPAR